MTRCHVWGRCKARSNGTGGLSKDKMHEIRKEFILCDKDKTGRIEIGELGQLLKDLKLESLLDEPHDEPNDPGVCSHSPG